KTNSKTKNRHKNKHTIEFTNNTHTPQNSHKKPQPSKKGEEATTPQSQTHNHKQSQRPATTRRNNKNNTHPTPNRQINHRFDPSNTTPRKIPKYQRIQVNTSIKNTEM
ncbi:hypothetical protein QP426_04255, partial [Pauljensenia sp. UMB1235]|uniref:hypothetical protein n=1 Tax=unclassified Pauljensenia TaxID=2908895 RepID=UPI00254E2A6A